MPLACTPGLTIPLHRLATSPRVSLLSAHDVQRVEQLARCYHHATADEWAASLHQARRRRYRTRAQVTLLFPALQRHAMPSP